MARRRPNGFLIRASIFLAVLHAWTGWQLLPDLHAGVTGWALGVGFLVMSSALIPTGFLLRFSSLHSRWSDRITLAGYLCMGAFSSLWVLTLLRGVLLLLFHPSEAWVQDSAFAVVLLSTWFTLVGYVNAHRLPGVVHVTVPIKGLPDAFEGFSIAQITDLHVGPTLRRDFVERVVARVNALAPDLVAITGDMVDGNVSNLSNHTEPLAQLRAREGVYCVTGNHEYYSGALDWIAEWSRLGLKALLNQHVVLERQGARLVVAGVTDYNAAQFIPAHASDPVRALGEAARLQAPKVLLAHQPRSASAAADAGFDLQISGHTHGGQFWPWNHFVRFQQPFTAGLHKWKKMWVYTSRGTGYWGPPKRFLSPAEITLLRLVSDNTDG